MAVGVAHHVADRAVSFSFINDGHAKAPHVEKRVEFFIELTGVPFVSSCRSYEPAALQKRKLAKGRPIA